MCNLSVIVRQWWNGAGWTDGVTGLGIECELLLLEVLFSNVSYMFFTKKDVMKCFKRESGGGARNTLKVSFILANGDERSWGK